MLAMLWSSLNRGEILRPPGGSVFANRVKKAERDAEPKHEGDGKFHHPRIERSEKSVNSRDWASLSTVYVYG
jgi:hypothetical protein